jgi:hypothetical protein
MNDPLPINPSAPSLDGEAGRSQGPRMAQGASAGRGRVGTMGRNRKGLAKANDWPGKTCGIRAPEAWETPLNHAEVACFVRSNGKVTDFVRMA